MFTVVAIDESLMHEIGEFEALLDSVAQKGEYKICGWKRNEVTLQKAIPALFDREFLSEGELLEWDILVVSDNRSCYAHNPFEGEYVHDSASVNIKDVRLNELAKMLGVIPVDAAFTEPVKDEENGRITHSIRVDRTTRDEKLAQYVIPDFTRPNRIYLLAVQKKEDVALESFKNEDGKRLCQYGHFAADGLYPPNCRFLKFNLTSVSNKITTADYFRLWMSVMSLAYSDNTERVHFAAETLYSIDADIDREIVQAQINEIFSRVHGVRTNLDSRIAYIHRMREFNQSQIYRVPHFSADIRVEYQTDESGLYLDESRFGLAKNCPVDNDERIYTQQRTAIEKRIKDYLKAPVRALRKSVYDTKEQGVYHHETDEFIYLNREQREDLDEEINTIEVELLDTVDVDVRYPKENALLRKQADKRSKSVMKKRSTRGAIILASLAALAAFFISFLPYIFGKTVEQRTGESYMQSLLVSGICIALIAIVGFITLLILKRPLKSALHHFKKIIDALVSYVKKQATAYTNYLSKLSVFMQMNSFKRHVDSNVDSYKRDEENTLVLNRNYCLFVEELCKRWADSLNFSLSYNDTLKTVVFDLDNKPEQNSVFSFVVSKGDFGIAFNRAEDCLCSPYPFIRSLKIISEEVYE